MPKTMPCLLCLFFTASLQAQYRFSGYVLQSPAAAAANLPAARTLYQRNNGAILGLTRGNITSVEMGAEMHWRKMSLRNPGITGATANLDYNFGHHVLGYKLGVWQKQGRVNLTYGGNLVYYTNFHGLQRYGLGPAVGFRLAGFHLINGYNILLGDKEFKDVNKLYITLRYYFPVDNKFTWDRETMRKKRAKQKARSKRQKERERGERWNWRRPFVVPKKNQ